MLFFFIWNISPISPNIVENRPVFNMMTENIIENIANVSVSVIRTNTIFNKNVIADTDATITALLKVRLLD